MDTVKTDQPGLVRDLKTQAILSIDIDGLNSYKKNRDRMLKADQTAQDVEKLKQDILEIKSMLSQLLDRT